MTTAGYGICNVKEIIRNPSYDQLYEEELNPNLVGYERGVVTKLGAVNVDTGVFTGRSPKDKYIVMDERIKTQEDDVSEGKEEFTLTATVLDGAAGTVTGIGTQ